MTDAELTALGTNAERVSTDASLAYKVARACVRKGEAFERAAHAARRADDVLAVRSNFNAARYWYNLAAEWFTGAGYHGNAAPCRRSATAMHAAAMRTLDDGPALSRVCEDCGRLDGDHTLSCDPT